MDCSYKYMQECLAEHYRKKTRAQLISILNSYRGKKKQDEFREKIYNLIGVVI